jgi:hypothetical protein
MLRKIDRFLDGSVARAPLRLPYSRLERAQSHRDLALLNMAIDDTLHGCDLVRMQVVDVMASGQIIERAAVMQIAC